MRDAEKRRHLEFLRTEFHENGFLLNDPFELSRDLLSELIDTIFIAEHEGIQPTHGALILSHPVDEFDRQLPFGKHEPGFDAGSNMGCDGTNIFRAKCGEASWLIPVATPIVDELGLFTLRDDALYKLPGFTHEDSPELDLFAIKRTEDGSITILCREGIATHRAARLHFHKYQYSYKKKLLKYIEKTWGLSPWGKQVLDSTLRVMVHMLGPLRGIGGTVVLFHPTEAHVEAGNSLADAPYLNNKNSITFSWPLKITQRAHQQILVNLMKINDGAIVISPDGEVSLARSWLTPPMGDLNTEESHGGTRHLTAKVFSKHIKGLVFVTSADGPVSIYAEGNRIVYTPDLE